MNKRIFSIGFFLLFIVFGAFAVNKSTKNKTPFALFPFDSGVGRGIWTPEQQAGTLQEFGYSGIGYNYTNLEELKKRIAAFDVAGLKIYSLYIGSNVGNINPLPAEIEDVMKLIQNRGIVIWLNMYGPKDAKKGSLDKEAVEIINKVSKMSRKYKVQVALYGHKNLYIETAEDGQRLLEKAKVKNVKNSFNLCHELMYGNENRLKEIITKCAKDLILVSINGADVKNKQYIQRLDQGDFDMAGLIKTLKDVGYKGPVGLQCFNVPGDQKENLRINMVKWNEIISNL